MKSERRVIKFPVGANMWCLYNGHRWLGTFRYKSDAEARMAKLKQEGLIYPPAPAEDLFIIRDSR